MDDPASQPALNRPEQDTPRDHLANERTYLAWLRTAVALVSIGLVVARLRLDALGVPGEAGPETGWFRHLVGIGFTVLGNATLIMATWRYFAVRRMLQRGEFAPLGGGVMAITLGVLAVTGAVFAYLVSLVAR